MAWNSDCCGCDVLADDGPAGKSIKLGCIFDVADDDGSSGKFILLRGVVLVVCDFCCCDVVADDVSSDTSIWPPVLVLEVGCGSVFIFGPGGTLRFVFSGPSLRLALISCNDRKASSAACGVMML